MARNISDKCDVCDLSAGAIVLFRQYCQPEQKQKCQKLVREFQKGGMSLKELGERLGASQEFVKSFGVDIGVTPKEIIKRGQYAKRL